MLSREIMGYLALAVLWVNTLLIAAAAFKELAALLERRNLLRPPDPESPLSYALLKARVLRGDGPDGAFASLRIEQLGRSAGDPDRRRAILFSDRNTISEIFGGAVHIEGAPSDEEAQIAPASEAAEIWLSESAMRAAAACPSPDRFDAAYDDARKARGFARTVETIIPPETPIWIAGDILRPHAGALRVAPSRARGLLISTLDPRPLLTRKIALSLAAILAILAGAAACTALALTRPYFGTLSTIGGALSLAYFLLVQPAGTALRDAVRLPHRAPLRGEWTSPARKLASQPRAS
jgi:hypothetical protein